jgi:hypothetical protein
VHESLGALTFDEPLEGFLYHEQIVPIPELAGGDTIFIPLVLEQYPYTLPNHLWQLEKIGYTGSIDSVIQYGRNCLKMGGRVLVEAQLVCKSSFMGEWEPCYDQDIKEIVDSSPICPSLLPQP